MRKVVAAAVSLAAAVVGLAAPAQADVGTVTRVSLDSPTDVYPSQQTLLLSRQVTMLAGESRHIRTRLQATSSTTSIVSMNNRIDCRDAAGQQVGVSSTSSRNHEGYDTTYYATDGHLPIYADLLFTAPTSGQYTCGLWAYTASTSSTSYHLTAVAGSTWLELSDVDQVGSHWWQNLDCDSRGTLPTCTYLGAGKSTAWVFYTDGTPIYKWAADPNATSVSASANLELTTCYIGTASCTGVGPYQKSRGTNSTVDVRLEFIQLDTTNHTCRMNATSTIRRTVRDDAHHYVFNLSLPSVPVDPTCGTPNFILRIYVKHTSGNPVKIDGMQNTSLTNGIALNQTYA